MNSCSMIDNLNLKSWTVGSNSIIIVGFMTIQCFRHVYVIICLFLQTIKWIFQNSTGKMYLTFVIVPSYQGYFASPRGVWWWHITYCILLVIFLFLPLFFNDIISDIVGFLFIYTHSSHIVGSLDPHPTIHVSIWEIPYHVLEEEKKVHHTI